jgi:hypothetical protein
VIYTVFTHSEALATEHQRRLLEFSWHRAQQPGQLIRLQAEPPAVPSPSCSFARRVSTTSWRHHPYTGDTYPPYDTAAAAFEWLFCEGCDGTVLLLEPHCVLTAAVPEEVEPGQAFGTPWPELPAPNGGPFGLGADYAFLDRFCVNTALPVDLVSLPVRIHTQDLRKMAARWLELMGILRSEGAPGVAAHRVAYVVAAAEFRIRHQPTVHPGPEGETCPPILALRSTGETDRQLRSLLDDFTAFCAAGGELQILRPRRKPGVRERREGDYLLLEIPGRTDGLSLNLSAAAIWQQCDSIRSVLEIASRLEDHLRLEQGALREDVARTIDLLIERGALDLVKP